MWVTFSKVAIIRLHGLRLHTICLVTGSKPITQKAIEMSQTSNAHSRSKSKLSAREAVPEKRMGKRTAAESRETRRALLRAAADAFAEHGFSGAKIDDIADRAGVTKGAIYGHFNGREDLLIEACRSALRELNIYQFATDAADIETFINKTTEALLAPKGKAVRMLNIEVHLSATRSEDMARLLADWHADGLATLRNRLPKKLGSPEAVFAVIQCLLLGFSHIDAFDPTGADRSEVFKITKKITANFIDASEQ